jgi:hypothetical protein
MRLCRSALAVLSALALAACSTAHIDRVPAAGVERVYDQLYPYYAEICAVSELKKKPGFGIPISSGMGGHSIIYLNGVCRVRGAGYPVIGLCGADTRAAERGVGLSVNAHFKNANWVATPGRNFLFHGTLKPGERLTREVYERTQARAKQLGIYDGIAFHSEVFDDKPPRMSRHDFKYEISVATDYAISFGRDRYCARVPLDRERMMKVVAFLNGLNDRYRGGAREFDWNVLNNNCSHVSHDALAAAGLWRNWPMGQFILFAAFDFPVPKNEFVNLMRRTNDRPIDDIDAVYADPVARRALLRHGWLSTEPGALAEAEPADQKNDLYDTDLRLIFYDVPFFGSYRPHFAQIFADPRYTDLATNLRYFAGLYRTAERRRRPLADFLVAHDAVTGPRRDALTRFYEDYYRYIGREAARVGADLALLAHVPGAPEATAAAPSPPPARSPGVPRS